MVGVWWSCRNKTLLAFPSTYVPMAEQCWASTTGLLRHLLEVLVQPERSCWQHPRPLGILKSPPLLQVRAPLQKLLRDHEGSSSLFPRWQSFLPCATSLLSASGEKDTSLPLQSALRSRQEKIWLWRPWGKEKQKPLSTYIDWSLHLRAVNQGLIARRRGLPLRY